MFEDENGNVVYHFVEPENINAFYYLNYCDNFLTSILHLAIVQNWESIDIELKDSDIKKWNSGKYTLEYFRKHGYNKEINAFYYKRILFCLLADYVENVSNSLVCAGRKQIVACYTLLRKPLKDNLYFLELLNTQGYWFINRFSSADIKKYDRIEEKTRKNVINRNCKLLQSGKHYKEIYNFRYNKKCNYGLEGIWNRAAHIITTCSSYKTENGNFNMIFNDKKRNEELLKHYFSVMPLISSYTVELILNLLKKEKLISDFEFEMNYAMFRLKTISAFGTPEMNDEIINNILFTCPCCNTTTQIKFDQNLKDDVLCNSSTICSSCNQKIRLDKFLNYEKE